jgi:hypothetical protein
LNFSQILQAKKDAAMKKDIIEDNKDKDNKDNQGEITLPPVTQDNEKHKEENIQ